MTFLLRYWPHLLAILLAFGSGAWVGSQLGNARANKAELALSHVQRDAAQQLAAEEARARQAEHRHAADMARIERETRERVKEEGDAAYDRAVADVRAGRLRGPWSCAASAGVPGAGATAAEPDAAADDRSESAGRIVRAAAECDAQVIGLQGIIRADRAKTGD